MVKNYLLSGSEWLGEIQVMLGRYIGMVAEMADLRPIITAVIEKHFLGLRLREGHRPEDILRGYHAGLPSVAVQELEETLKDYILLSLRRTFGATSPTQQYSFEFINNVDLHIQVEDIEALPDFTLQMPVVREEVAYQQAYGSDYIPERMRQEAVDDRRLYVLPTHHVLQSMQPYVDLLKSYQISPQAFLSAGLLVAGGADYATMQSFISKELMDTHGERFTTVRDPEFQRLLHACMDLLQDWSQAVTVLIQQICGKFLDGLRVERFLGNDMVISVAA